jgi:hypothetical protein
MSDVEQVYFSPLAYANAFEEILDMTRYYATKFPVGGLRFPTIDNRLILDHTSPETPCTKIRNWRSRLKHAWLISIDGTPVDTVEDVNSALHSAFVAGRPTCVLLFSHPEIRHGLTNEGIPQVLLDQLNPRLLFDSFFLPQPPLCKRNRIRQSWDGEVLQYVTKAQRLTHGRLITQDNWSEWNQSEFTQLNQYEAQGMFGEPCTVDSEEAVFNLVWTYAIKEVDNRKKARCTCDGSPCSGQVRVLDFTYANCVDQTSARIFYSVSAAENLIIYGADVSNAFAEAPPPNQGFYIRPDKAFLDWWVNHKGRPLIPPGHVIPILSAMQGHPESPWLWEKHADAILRKLGLMPTTHEPCLYSEIISNHRILFFVRWMTSLLPVKKNQWRTHYWIFWTMNSLSLLNAWGSSTYTTAWMLFKLEIISRSLVQHTSKESPRNTSPPRCEHLTSPLDAPPLSPPGSLLLKVSLLLPVIPILTCKSILQNRWVLATNRELANSSML